MAGVGYAPQRVLLSCTLMLWRLDARCWYTALFVAVSFGAGFLLAWVRQRRVEAWLTPSPGRLKEISLCRVPVIAQWWA